MAIHTDFTDAVMRGCKLVRATMRGANFSGSNLEGADLSGADLRGACLRGAVLTGASMTMTETAGADMEDMLTDQPVGRPVSALGRPLDELARDHMAWIGSAGAEGAKLDLSGFDLRGSPASLASMCLTMVKGIGTIFYGMNLEGIQLQAAQLEDSDLRTCRLKDADLRGINLKRAKLNNADMSGVNLRPLMIDDKRAMRSDLEGAKLRYVNLNGACLRGSELRRRRPVLRDPAGRRYDEDGFPPRQAVRRPRRARRAPRPPTWKAPPGSSSDAGMRCQQVVTSGSAMRTC